jgi:hypothetical protein
MKSIYNLDTKKIINFLSDVNLENINLPEQNIISHKIANTTLWEIENFISPEICANIINKSNESGFDQVDFRPMERLICWDESNNLIKLIELNLKAWSDQLDDLNWEIPRGFGNNFIVWDKNKPKINQCLRINKYVSNTIPTHRDAQYTQSKTVKSNYTLLIYLNDDTIDSGGDTEFVFPTIDYEHNGLTLKQELDLIGNNYSSLKIKPKTGKAIIFPHFLLHGSTQLDGLKYVLRTDLICFGRLKEFYELPKAIKLDDVLIYESELYGYNSDKQLNIYNKYMYEYEDIDNEFDSLSESESNSDKKLDSDFINNHKYLFDPYIDSNYDVIILESNPIKNPDLATDCDKQIKLDIWLDLIKSRYIDYKLLVEIINNEIDYKNNKIVSNKNINDKKSNKNLSKNKTNQFNNMIAHINIDDLKELNYLPSKNLLIDYFESMNEYYYNITLSDYQIDNYDGKIVNNKLDNENIYQLNKNYIINGGDYILPKTLDIYKRKYFILRDRYCLETIPSNELENKIESLAKKLFRQAQLYELENSNLSESSDLYEIVLSLRVEPRKITKYPEHLEKLLTNGTIFNYNYKENHNIDYMDMENIDVIELDCRNGEKYEFNYEQKFLSKVDIIKICILFATFTSVYEITDERVDHQVSQIKKLLNLENDFILRKKIRQNKNIKKYEFEKSSYTYENYKSKLRNLICDIIGYDDKINQEDILDKYKEKYSNYILDNNLSLDNLQSIEDICNNPHPLCLSGDFINVNFQIPWNDCCMEDYNNCYYRCVKKDDIDANFYSNMQWNMVMDDFLLELVDIKQDENIISGSINITTLNKTFNHASCQTYYDTQNSSISFVDSEDFAKFYRTTWNIKWDLSEKDSKVTIYLEPKVVM